MKTLTKILGGVALLSTSALVGDYCDVMDSVYYPTVYSDVPVAKDCFKNPFDLHKEYRVKDGFLEVYFGSEKMYKVKKGLSVNQKSLGELLRNRGESFMKKSKMLFFELIDEILEGDM